jgi:3-oxoacyl-[acyl-carrier protein] reductase
MTKVAIITGASSGIGAASARELSSRGWSVVINYATSAAEANEVAASCKDAIAVAADVAEDAECRKLAQAALDKWGRIDALVNNAGTTKFVDHADLDGLFASHLGVGSSVAYAASKAALNTMTYSLARSLGPEVRVNAVCPGYVDTPWHSNAHGVERANQIAAHYAKLVPLKDYARPDDVADVIVWLIEGARQVTGEAIFVDGGLHITPPR